MSFQIKEQIYRKLILPMRRSYKDPKYTARAVMIGLGGAFLPFPVQMPVVFAIWLIAKKIKWRFSLMIGLAWTWVSNAFTNLPLFYCYYIVGKIFRKDSVSLSYAQIKEVGLQQLFTELTLSIVIGSCFFIVIFGFIGYWIGYIFAQKALKQKTLDEIQKLDKNRSVFE